MRSLPRILYFLLIGTLLTVLTSWALACFGTFSRGDLFAGYEPGKVHPPPSMVPEDWDVYSWHWWAGMGIRRDLVSECKWMGSTLGMTMDGRRQWTVIHIRVGFPMHAMTWYDYHSDPALVPLTGVKRAWWYGFYPGWTTSSAQRGEWGRAGIDPRLPVRPLWSPFLVNTLFYSLLALGIVATFGACRRARWRRHGRCTRCGYDLRAVGGGAKCPECGMAQADQR